MEAGTRVFHLLDSTGAVRAGYHVHDWAGSPLGAPEAWSPALRHAASLILESECPMYLAWGPHLGLLYNAAFMPLLGNIGSEALGRPMAQVWPERWASLKPLVERALGGHATYGEDVPSTVYRDGKPANAWFTLAYSPLRDDLGVVRGVLCVTGETTARVQLERRHAVQLQVVDNLRRLHHPSDIIESACTLLGRHLDLEHACYVETDEEDGTFEVVHDWARDAGAPLIGRRARLDDFGPQALALLRTGAPLAVNDALADPRLPARGERYAAAGARAILVVPKMRRGRLLAALVGYGTTARDWDEEDQRVATDIAERSWEALDRVRAEQALRDAVARQTTLLDMNEFRLEISDLLRRLTEPAQVFLQAGAMLGRFLQASRVRYGDYDADKQLVTFHSNYTDGIVSELNGTFPAALFGAANFAALAQGTWVSSDLQRDPRTSSPDVWPNFAALQIRSGVVVPLNRSGAITTCLFIDDNLPRVWSADIVRLIEDVAERAWTAAERVRAEEALRLADRRKDEFLAMLAHELRNPLAPISAAAQLLNMGGTPDRTRVERTSAIIARQVTHMTGLIDDLLDVSRVTRGLVVLARDEVDLRDVIADAVEQVRPLIEARRHVLALHLAGEPALVEGDPKRLVQVLANLLNNAAKYTQEGGRLSIWMGATPDHVLVSVSDNGIGIAADLLPTVFDLFSQAERTPDRAQGGLGLGLALVKSLVELHGGMVTVASEGRHRGSEFTLRLPRLRSAVPAGRSAAPQAAPAGGAARVLNLMLVDDNVDAAMTLGLLLEAAGHRVTVLHNPLDALARAAAAPYDAFLLDIGLPGMNGYELARNLRKLPGCDQAVLAAITGYGQQSDQATAAYAGFDRYFVKPVDSAALFALLEQVAARPQ